MEIIGKKTTDPDVLELFSQHDDFMLDFLGNDSRFYTRYGEKENIERVWAAYDGGLPVGCIAYRTKEDGVGEVKRLFVKEDYRGRGLSKRLLQTVERYAKEKGCHTLYLDTRITLEPAVSLYRSAGFQMIFQQGLYIQMEKELPEREKTPDFFSDDQEAKKMKEREKRIRRYFNAWLENAPDCLPEIFGETIVYSECYGPEYRGLGQIKKWFADWNRHGKVLEWDIKGVLHQGSRTAVEWYFRCEYDGNTDGFDGVSLIEFDEAGKIVSLKEFQSKAEHVFPYGEEMERT